jgi:hypothetical protein
MRSLRAPSAAWHGLARIAVSLALALPLLASDAPQSLAPRTAQAAVSMRLTLPELVAASKYVVVATPAERHSVWEDLAGGRRIVTYTRLVIDRSVVGAPGGEVWVRTLGGEVGSIGQAVAGEAHLRTGERSLDFLAEVPGTFVVTGLGQGHFPIANDESGTPKLRAATSRPGLITRRGPSIGADEVLVGTALDDATVTIQRAHRAIQDAQK